MSTTAPFPFPAPVVIGHRGAAGYRPEHTLASYQLAIEQGADYIEPDLVSTRDGVLVARHENQIGATTDVADRPEFARRHTTKVVDGRSVRGWFTEDFTLSELKTLRAKERLPRLRPANSVYDGHFEVPTFDEILDLAREVGRRRGIAVGVYPETKLPSYFDSIGLSLGEPLVAALRRHGLDRADAPVLVQSFETGNLRTLASITPVRLVQLVDASGAPYDLASSGDPRTYHDLVTPAGLREISTYAAGVGVHHELLQRHPGLVGEAHRTARGPRMDGARRARPWAGIETVRSRRRRRVHRPARHRRGRPCPRRLEDGHRHVDLLSLTEWPPAYTLPGGHSLHCECRRSQRH